MAAANPLPDVLETTEPERVCSGFIFTEGPLWHPDGYWYFVDMRANRLHRIVPGHAPEIVATTQGGNGATFDLAGRLVLCEGSGRRVVRVTADGSRIEPVAERFNGGRFSRPNDVICRSDGSLYFTDPDRRIPYSQREIPGPEGIDQAWDGSGVYRVTPDGSVSLVANCEYPNGLAFSPDERTLYVANTRTTKYLHALDLDADGRMTGRRIFADLNGDEPGVPDGVKVDVEGRVYSTAPGGIWVFTPAGKRIGIIRLPEPVANFAFGGPDMRTLFCCAHTSLYTLRVKVPGQPHPWYRLRSR